MTRLSSTRRWEFCDTSFTLKTQILQMGWKCQE
jgi:hypothetical protein